MEAVMQIYTASFDIFFMLKGSTKRLRLEKCQEIDMRIMNINMKKEDDMKSEMRGIKLVFNFTFAN